MTSRKIDRGIFSGEDFSIERKCNRRATAANKASGLFRRQTNGTHRKWRWRFDFPRGCLRPPVSATEAIVQQRPNRQPAIRVANLLAFSRRTRRVTDGHLSNLFTHSAEFRSHLGAELETMALKTNFCDQRAAENFVASGLVVDARTVKQICEVSQKFCAQKKS